MAATLGSIETDQQPPMAVPLRHFVVGLGFLLVGTVVGIAMVLDLGSGRTRLAHLHLLLAGWICVTIMGAMTQFVPVWSGLTIHSRRLASLQLVLVSMGLLGFVAALLGSVPTLLIPFGSLLFLGFWTFVYNVGRTMAAIEDYDVTERHFLVALGFFLALTVLGLLLAVGQTQPVFAGLPVDHSAVVGTHATLAVFGAVLTTIYGALYQLATMFTQTELHGVDHYLRPIEEIGHPVGVVMLALGRLTDSVLVARVGGVLVLAAALGFSVILARRLLEMQVPRTPMHTRYAVVVPALGGWALLSVPAWLEDPTAGKHLFGAPGAGHLLVLGAIGFVLFGTLYHIIPFIVWVNAYSDDLGFKDVPMIDDLYDDRLAAADAILIAAGTAVLVAADLLATVPPTVVGFGGVLVALGVVVFAANLLQVIRVHGPLSLTRVVLGSVATWRPGSGGDDSVVPEDAEAHRGEPAESQVRVGGRE
jgi:hypothetical protein